MDSILKERFFISRYERCVYINVRWLNGIVVKIIYVSRVKYLVNE